MEMEAPGFWDNPEISNQKMKELKNLQDSVKAMHDLETQYEDIETLIEMGNEANDEEMAEEIREELDSFIETFEEIRIGTLLSEEYDSDNAILKLNAGAGGTESCDWCSMLYRMYTRWAGCDARYRRGCGCGDPGRGSACGYLPKQWCRWTAHQQDFFCNPYYPYSHRNCGAVSEREIPVPEQG